jgi:hypothetical protein
MFARGDSMRGVFSFLLLVSVVACGGESRAPASPVAAVSAAPAPVRTAPLWEFHSDPWVNLHQRLIAEATWNKYWHSPAETCICAKQPDGTILPAWQAAVAVYKEDIGKRNVLFDTSLIKTNFSFALLGTNPSLPKDDTIDEAVAKSINGVFETYMRGAWQADDARNRKFIAEVEPLVAKYGPDMAQEIAKRFDTKWPSYPIRVEVTEWAGFGGAYTVGDPILTTMSSADPGYRPPATLEMLFHEALHGIDANLDHDLQMAFAKVGKREPRSLDHVIIFYTAGELARRRLGPSYVPYAYKEGVYKRGWEKLEPAVRQHWQPWLDDKIDLETALTRLANASYE